MILDWVIAKYGWRGYFPGEPQRGVMDSPFVGIPPIRWVSEHREFEQNKS
jgi:hypothetical protein